MSNLDIWKLIAGLGIFLFGIQLLEKAITKLAGDKLRNFLQTQTNNRFTAILAGTGTTALLQSSSLVSLIVLSFVGTGIIEMKNALGIIFGSNLGTTFTGWLATSLGFMFNIENLALPLIAMGSIGTIFFANKKYLPGFTFLFGLGLLLLGLAFMKTSTETLSELLNLNQLHGYSAFIFLFSGILFTAIIQSSSAAMMITLSALNSGIIDLHSAAALVVGADLGTSSTVLLGAIKGSAVKKQVAMAHLLFNLVTDSIAFLSIPILIGLINNYTTIENPLYTLVAFHSSFNLIGLCIFVPLINPFAVFLERYFVKEAPQHASFLNKTLSADPDTALKALNKESKSLIEHVIQVNINVLKIDAHQENIIALTNRQASLSYLEHYEKIKSIEGEAIDYGRKLLQDFPAESTEEEKINNSNLTNRHAVMAATSLKDIHHKLSMLRYANTPTLKPLHLLIHNFESHFYLQLITLWKLEHNKLSTKTLATLHSENKNFYDQCIRFIYRKLRRSGASPHELKTSSLLDICSQIFTSNSNILNSIEFYLSQDEQKNLEDHPSLILDK